MLIEVKASPADARAWGVLRGRFLNDRRTWDLLPMSAFRWEQRYSTCFQESGFGAVGLLQFDEDIKKTYKIKSGSVETCSMWRDHRSSCGITALLRYHVHKAGKQKGEPTMVRWLLVKI